jgi:hypothetical protein
MLFLYPLRRLCAVSAPSLREKTVLWYSTLSLKQGIVANPVNSMRRTNIPAEIAETDYPYRLF